MKVYVQGGGSLALTQSCFVGQGGEGSVYARGGTAYKVYTDPARLIPPGKICELGALTLPCIIKPEKLLLSGPKREPIGYAMRYVENCFTLCQLFPRVFRDRHGLAHGAMLDLVRQLMRGVEHVHAAGCLVVDLNEMNFLVSRDLKTIYFIDVDSYQTPHYPATAVMPSVRDWRAPGTASSSSRCTTLVPESSRAPGQR